MPSAEPSQRCDCRSGRVARCCSCLPYCWRFWRRCILSRNPRSRRCSTWRPGSPSSTPFSSCSSAWSRYPCSSWPTRLDRRTPGPSGSASACSWSSSARTTPSPGSAPDSRCGPRGSCPPTQQEGVLAVVQDWPGLGPPFALSILGTLGWVIAVGALAITAYRQRTPRVVWIALALAAVFLLGGHPFPAGTLAFGSFFVAAFLLEWSFHRQPANPSGTGE